MAQAGIAGMKGDPPLRAWTDVIDTNLLGVINAVPAVLPVDTPTASPSWPRRPPRSTWTCPPAGQA